MKLEIGKRYRRRDGKETGPIAKNHIAALDKYPFIDPVANCTYVENGCYSRNLQVYPEDLIEEIPERNPMDKAQELQTLITDLEGQLTATKAKLEAIRNPPKPPIRHGDYGYVSGDTDRGRVFILTGIPKNIASFDYGGNMCNPNASEERNNYTIKGNIFDDMKAKQQA